MHYILFIQLFQASLCLGRTHRDNQGEVCEKFIALKLFDVREFMNGAGVVFLAVFGTIRVPKYYSCSLGIKICTN